MIAGFRSDRNADGFAFHQPHELPVAGITWIGQKHPGAGIDGRRRRQLQGARGAGGNQNAPGRDRDPVALLVMVANSLAQFRQTGGGGVAGAAFRQRPLAGGADRAGGRKIRFADFQVNDRAAGGFQFPGAGQQHHDVKWRDVRRATGQRDRPEDQNGRPRCSSSSWMDKSVRLAALPPPPVPSASRICRPTLFLESAFLMASSREILPSLYSLNND